MKTKNEQWALLTLIRKENVIDPKPPYQRGPVWSEPQKQLLIDSILRDIDIPKIYLRVLPQKNNERRNPIYQYEIIDGQQRLGAIWEFFKGDFSLPPDADPIGKNNIKDLEYQDLPEQLKDELDTRQLSIVLISEAEDIEIEEMFLRLQNGTTLKAAERRNAISGKIRNFVKHTSQNKFLKKSVGFKDARFAFDAITAQMLAIELAGGPTDIKDRDLEKMYKLENFDSNGRQANNFQKTLKYLTQEFNERTPELKKQVVVSLYLMTSELLKKYNVIRVLKRGKFKEWFLKFEEYKNAELNKSEEERRDSDIESYNLHLQQGTNRKESLQARFDVLMKNFLIRFPEVEYKDTQRVFSFIQRLAVFRRDGGKCRDCKKKVDWENFHVDHIKPHSKGGKTSLKNAQLLCASCNLKKGAN